MIVRWSRACQLGPSLVQSPISRHAFLNGVAVSSLPLIQNRACSQDSKAFKVLNNNKSRAIHHSTPRRMDQVPVSTVKEVSASTMAENDIYSTVFKNNAKWRRHVDETDPGFFASLATSQSPQILWIGCSDSRCPETTIMGLKPGDVFVHRNIANILTSTDINSLSVIQYAVQYLKVKHIMVCGHTNCGGIAAALDNRALGLIDTWLMPIRSIRLKNYDVLAALSEPERFLKLVDLNIRSSVTTLLENPVVIDAIRDRGLQVHGVLYNVGTGELKELEIEEDARTAAEQRAVFELSGTH